MNDFVSLEKTIVRELSCRLCLCTDVMKLKPLNAEVKRKMKRLFDIVVRADDSLPKAICHDCLQQISAMHLYAVKVDKTQKFLDFHKAKQTAEKPLQVLNTLHPIIALTSESKDGEEEKTTSPLKTMTPPFQHQQGDANPAKPKTKKKSNAEMKFLEAMPLEEFATAEKVDKSLLDSSKSVDKSSRHTDKRYVKTKEQHVEDIFISETIDPIVLIDGRPAKHGAALDKQITLFYKMECCICHENGFHFRSLMKHYKERHGVPGYVTCCDKKFHYFFPKKIIEHMAFHLQPNIFMCQSCHQNFQTSVELQEHQSNGGRSEGKIICPRCQERYPTYHELGMHLASHRADKLQCDYCGKLLKHHRRKKNVNQMEDVILCSICLRSLKNIEKQERDNRDKIKLRTNDLSTQQKLQKFRQAIGLSADEDESTD